MRFPMAWFAVTLLTIVLSVSLSSALHESLSTALSIRKKGIKLHYEGCHDWGQAREIKKALNHAFDIIRFVTEVRENPSGSFGHLTPEVAVDLESKYFGSYLSQEKRNYITSEFKTLHARNLSNSTQLQTSSALFIRRCLLIGPISLAFASMTAPT